MHVLGGKDASALFCLLESVGEQVDLWHGWIFGFERRDFSRAIIFEKQQPTQIKWPAVQAGGQRPGLVQTLADRIDQPGTTLLGKQSRGMAKRSVVG